MKITATELRALVHYDLDTGIFTWRKDGNIASRTRTDGRYAGYVRAFIKSYPYQAARLAWLYVHGEWPNGEVDHANRVRADNRFSNLRLSDRAQNGKNRKIHKNNTSGVRGVCFDKRRQKWKAQIWVKGRRNIVLGLFSSIHDASVARVTAERKLFGEFAPS
jgi:hypothetical protein